MGQHTGFALAEMLVDYGVEYIFGIPGGQTLPLYEADYAERAKLKHVVMRDERSAGHAACAYARISGKVGVCDATVGPGATNLVSALGEALNSSTAMVAIVSDHPVGWVNHIDFGRASQGIDQVGLLKSVSKAVFRVPSPDRLPELVKAAFIKATTGRPGPVVLDVPADVFRQEYDFQHLENYVDPECGRFPARRTAPDPGDVRKAARLLRDARRPVMLVGGGALISRAMDQVKQLAELLTMPVTTTFTGKGILPDDHPLCLGVVGFMAGTQSAEAALRSADLVFIVGSKSSQNSTFTWTVPTPEQKVIQLDIDPGEVGRVFRTDVGLVGDVRLGLDAVLGVLREGKEIAQDKGRLEWAQSLKQEWEHTLSQRVASDDVPLKPHRLMAELGRVMAPEDVLICDAGFASAWGALYFHQRKAGRCCIFPRGLAGIGFAVAAGVGAQLAAPERRVVTLGGDGAFTYVMPELSTQARFNLPVVNIVLNNAAFGWVKWAEQAWYHGTFKCSDLGKIDFAKVAEALGAVGLRVEEPSQVRTTLAKALSMRKPVVVEAITDPSATPM